MLAWDRWMREYRGVFRQGWNEASLHPEELAEHISNFQKAIDSIDEGLSEILRPAAVAVSQARKKKMKEREMENKASRSQGRRRPGFAFMSAIPGVGAGEDAAKKKPGVCPTLTVSEWCAADLLKTIEERRALEDEKEKVEAQCLEKAQADAKAKAEANRAEAEAELAAGQQNPGVGNEAEAAESEKPNDNKTEGTKPGGQKAEAEVQPNGNAELPQPKTDAEVNAPGAEMAEAAPQKTEATEPTMGAESSGQKVEVAQEKATFPRAGGDGAKAEASAQEKGESPEQADYRDGRAAIRHLPGSTSYHDRDGKTASETGAQYGQATNVEDLLTRPFEKTKQANVKKKVGRSRLGAADSKGKQPVPAPADPAAPEPFLTSAADVCTKSTNAHHRLELFTNLVRTAKRELERHKNNKIKVEFDEGVFKKSDDGCDRTEYSEYFVPRYVTVLSRMESVVSDDAASWQGNAAAKAEVVRPHSKDTSNKNLPAPPPPPRKVEVHPGTILQFVDPAHAITKQLGDRQRALALIAKRKKANKARKEMDKDNAAANGNATATANEGRRELIDMCSGSERRASTAAAKAKPKAKASASGSAQTQNKPGAKSTSSEGRFDKSTSRPDISRNPGAPPGPDERARPDYICKRPPPGSWVRVARVPDETADPYSALADALGLSPPFLLDLRTGEMREDLSLMRNLRDMVTGFVAKLAGEKDMEIKLLEKMILARNEEKEKNEAATSEKGRDGGKTGRSVLGRRRRGASFLATGGGKAMKDEEDGEGDGNFFWEDEDDERTVEQKKREAKKMFKMRRRVAKSDFSNKEWDKVHKSLPRIYGILSKEQAEYLTLTENEMEEDLKVFGVAGDDEVDYVGDDARLRKAKATAKQLYGGGISRSENRLSEAEQEIIQKAREETIRGQLVKLFKLKMFNGKLDRGKRFLEHVGILHKQHRNAVLEREEAVTKLRSIAAAAVESIARSMIMIEAMIDTAISLVARPFSNTITVTGDSEQSWRRRTWNAVLGVVASDGRGRRKEPVGVDHTRWGKPDDDVLPDAGKATDG
eukprot:g16306.t1